VSEHSAEKDAGLIYQMPPLEVLARRLVRERLAHYGYTPEQIDAAEIVTDHYKAGCSMDGAYGWICEDENGKPTHPESDEYDRAAEWVMWVLEALRLTEEKRTRNAYDEPVDERSWVTPWEAR
jgi:hypothetical protein